MVSIVVVFFFMIYKREGQKQTMIMFDSILIYSVFHVFLEAERKISVT